ncbi:hypothetical protein AVEN_43891-1 [Araneus ventricosus]|uniref:Uncharacterized protein n=1 Tax=Araneus ventricosus TaxID=182803 RepID=A0A4Y2U3Y9_ARAVE|nr:hypothetical protein AVEN_43891-1 [Araneus ventricosus]
MDCRSLFGVLSIFIFMGSYALEYSPHSDKFIAEVYSLPSLIDMNTAHGNVGGMVQRCPEGQRYDTYLKECRFLHCVVPGYEMRNGQCRLSTCPRGQIYDQSFRKCVCANPNYEIVDGLCIPPVQRCPEGQRYDRYLKECRLLHCLVPGYEMRNGQCRPSTCPRGQIYDQTFRKCVCANPNYEIVDGQCRSSTCPRGQIYHQIFRKCVCAYPCYEILNGHFSYAQEDSYDSNDLVADESNFSFVLLVDVNTKDGDLVCVVQRCPAGRYIVLASRSATC